MPCALDPEFPYELCIILPARFLRLQIGWFWLHRAVHVGRAGDKGVITRLGRRELVCEELP
jgi:hypothetical protein